MPFIFHKINDGTFAKLFFPKEMKHSEIIDMYYSLITEQDKRSPHCYFDQEHMVSNQEVLLDIGAAEGIVALTYINEIKGAIIFEGDAIWEEPLRLTFQPYCDKVRIVNAYVSDKLSKKEVLLSDYINDTEQYFIKMDVEGMEMQILDSIKKVLVETSMKASICVYHKLNDPNDIASYFESIGYRTRFSLRHMCVAMNDNKLSFRKGILYAERQ